MLKLVSLLFISISFSSLSFAEADFVSDFSASVSARSFPVGGGLTGKAGLSHLIWGNKESDTDYLYGFVRGQLAGTTSVLWNQINTELELYPISFIGVSAGSASSRSATNSKDYACSDDIQCQSLVRTEYNKLKFALGARGIFLRVEQTQGKIINTFESPATYFIDFENTLRPLSQHDEYRRENTVLAYSRDKESVYFFVHDQMQDRFSGSHCAYDGFGFQRRQDKTAWTFILGVADAPLLRKDIGMIFSYEWTIKPSLKLF